MQTTFTQKSKRLLILLLLGDLFFVALHIILEIPHYTNYSAILELPFYHSYLLTVDGSFAEWYQYFKFVGIIFVIHHLMRQTKDKMFLAWGIFFAFLLLDDSLRFHERAGGFVANLLSITPALGLRVKDYGELIVLASAGGLLMVCLLVAYLHGSERFKKITIDISVLIMGLAFFAIVVDFLHPLFDIQLYRLVMGTLEDAGEMFVVSFVLWYVYRLSIGGIETKQYIYERVPVFRSLAERIFLKWHVDFGRLFGWLRGAVWRPLDAGSSLFVFGAYVLYIAFLTWPALGKLGNNIPGDGGDAYVHLWGFEWVRDSLFAGRSPFFTTQMFFPYGTELFSHNIAWLNIVFWLPLQVLVGSATAYTLLFLAAFVLNAFGGYWLTRELTQNRWAAFVGGLVLGGWQYTLAQFTKPNLVLLGFIPLAMWAILRVCKTADNTSSSPSSRRYTWLATLFIAAIGITRFQLLAISLVLLIPWTILCVWQHKAHLSSLIKRLLFAGVVAGLLIAPFVAPIILNQLNREFPADLYDTNQTQFVDLLSYVLPFDYHPFLEQIVQPHRFSVEDTFFIGFVPVLLLLFGLVKQRKNRWYWLLSLVALLILGLGDKLVINGESFFTLPYRWTRGTNIDGLVGNPNRFNVLLGIPFGVLVAFGAKGLFERMERVYRPLILLLLTIYITVEYQMPYRMVTLQTPAWYSDLAQEDGDFGILPIPHNRSFSETYMNYQRTHGKGIIEGHVSRVPREAYAFIEEVPLLGYLQENSPVAYEVEPPLQFANLSEQFEQLAAVDVRYIVFHKAFMHVDIVNRWREWLAVTPVFEDGEVVVFSTDLMGQTADFQPITNNIALVQAVNTTPNKRANQTIELVTHWLLSPTDPLPDEICLTLAISEACQSFDATVTGDNQLVRTVQRLKVDKTVAPDLYAINAQFKVDGKLIDERFQLSKAELAGPARLFERPEMANEVDVAYGDELLLLGVDELGISADNLTLPIFWQARVDQSHSTKYFIHILDSSDALVAQADAAPRNWSYPTTEWAKDEIVSDKIIIDISALPAGDYDIYFGMVDIETDERLLINNSEQSTYLLEQISIEK